MPPATPALLLTNAAVFLLQPAGGMLGGWLMIQYRRGGFRFSRPR